MTAFLPVGVVDRPNAATPLHLAAQERVASAAIEIVLPDGVRVRVDTCVDESALVRVLRAIRGAA